MFPVLFLLWGGGGGVLPLCLVMVAIPIATLGIVCSVRLVYSSRTLHAASLPTLSSFIFQRYYSPPLTAHRSPLIAHRSLNERKTENGKLLRSPLTPNDCPPETGATRSEATEGVDKTPLIRSPLIRSPLIRSPLTRSPLLYII